MQLSMRKSQSTEMMSGVDGGSPASVGAAANPGAVAVRTVEGSGGYVYEQAVDGTITVVSGPAGAGRVLSSGPAWEAITAEIGPHPGASAMATTTPGASVSALPAAAAAPDEPSILDQMGGLATQAAGGVGGLSEAAGAGLQAAVAGASDLVSGAANLASGAVGAATDAAGGALDAGRSLANAATGAATSFWEWAIGEETATPAPAGPAPATPAASAPAQGAPSPAGPTQGAPTQGAPTPGAPAPGAPTPRAPAPAGDPTKHASRTTFVRKPQVQENATTSAIIDTIYPYYSKDDLVIGGLLNDSQQAWKVNWHWEYLQAVIHDLLKHDVGTDRAAKFEAILANLASNPPDPASGYLDDAEPGETLDNSSEAVLLTRWSLVTQCKKDLEAAWGSSTEMASKSKYDQKALDLSVAPIMPPGKSKHGTGYALDISGNNAEIKSVSRQLGATMTFDEKSHVHVEFAAGVKT
jgi:hypothetical protein